MRHEHEFTPPQTPEPRFTACDKPQDSKPDTTNGPQQTAKTNIVLIGFMGCGKTAISQKLSGLLQMPVVDTDQEIEFAAGQPIANIFDTFGEAYFRNLELRVIQRVSALSGHIISTGGGIVKNPDNIRLLQANGRLIYLQASPERIFQNTKGDNTRPLLQGSNRRGRIEELLKTREPLYKACADCVVDVSHMELQESVLAVAKAWEELK